MPEELERLQINIEADASGTAAGAAQAKQALQGLQHDAKRVTDGIQRGMDKAAQATKSVAAAAEITRKTLKPLTENPVNVRAVRQANAAVRATQETVRKTLQPTAPNPVMPNGPGRGKYEFAKMPTKETAAAVQQTAKETAKLANNAGNAAEKVREVRKEVERVGRKGPSIMQSIGRSLRSMLIITVAARGVQQMVRWMGKLVAADKEVSASLAAVKANTATAFAPIYTAAIPAIRALIGWLANATAWIATFVSALFGMSGSDAQEIAKGLDGIGGAAGGAGKSMKELLGSFDELNKLDRTESSGGGGGGGLNFGELPEIESAVNAADKVSKFWSAWGDWIKGGAFAGGTAWLLSKFGDLIDKIKNGVGPISALKSLLDGLGSSSKALGGNLKDVNKNATIEFAEKGYNDLAKKISSISEFADAIDNKPATLRVKLLDAASGRLKTLLRTVKELAQQRPTIKADVDGNSAMAQLRMLRAQIVALQNSVAIKVTVHDSAALGAIANIKSALDDLPRVVPVTVAVTQTEYTLADRNGGGGDTRGGGGGRNDRYSSSSGGLSTSTAKSVISTVQDILQKVRGYASGGIGIPRGQLFIANESGAEMVGHIGGKTAVANQQEISGAIWREMQQYKGGAGANANDIAEAVARALNGTAVNVDGRRFGSLAVHYINQNARQSGRADFAF